MPFPDPVAPAVILIHGAEVSTVAVQPQPDAAATFTDPDEAVAGRLAEVADRLDGEAPVVLSCTHCGVPPNPFACVSTQTSRLAGAVPQPSIEPPATISSLCAAS